jgi:pimeloyl-ACP methyl ester carboxylesterase
MGGARGPNGLFLTEGLGGRRDFCSRSNKPLFVVHAGDRTDTAIAFLDAALSAREADGDVGVALGAGAHPVLEGQRRRVMDHQFVRVDAKDVVLRAAIAGEGPLVILVHGFPESWYSWRHQIAPIAAAGFKVCALDVRGYGGSDKPHAVEAYDMESLTGDVAAVADRLGAGQAILIGHDWGAPIVWNSARLYPDKIRAVAGLSVPYTGTMAAPMIDIFRAMFTERGLFFYQVYFQDEGVAEAELERDPKDSLARFYYAICGDAPDGTWPKDKPHGATLLDRLPRPQPFPAWLNEADLDYFAAEFAQSGFRGPLNRYRNWHRDFAFLRDKGDDVLRQPALFIGGDRDLVLKMVPGLDIVALMGPKMADLRGAHLLAGCGHWTQQERPDEVNRLLLDWLAGL